MVCFLAWLAIKYLIVIELFIRGKKLNIYLAFITKSYFAVLKNIRLNQAKKFQTTKSLNNSHLIIHQILTFKNL